MSLLAKIARKTIYLSNKITDLILLLHIFKRVISIVKKKLLQ